MNPLRSCSLADVVAFLARPVPCSCSASDFYPMKITESRAFGNSAVKKETVRPPWKFCHGMAGTRRR